MERLAKVVSWLVALLLITAVLINFSNVVGRYFFDQPIAWADEALGFLQIWFVVVGAALVTRANSHLRMDAAEHFMPARLRRWLEVLAAVLSVGVGIVVAVMSWQIAAGMFAADTRSVALEIPLGIPYTAFIVGFGLIAIFALLRLVGLLRPRE